MNKPLLTLAAFMALGAASLQAAVVTIEGDATEYATLEDAVAAAQSGAVITVHESYTSKASRNIINIADARALTIKGDDGVVISYSNLFVVNMTDANCSLTIENITFKNTTPDAAGNRNTFNIARGSATFKNVTIDGAYVKENNNRGIVYVNSSSNVTSLEFDNFQLVNCKAEPSSETATVAEVVLANNGNLVMKNECRMSIKLGANDAKTSFSVIKDASTFTGHADLVLDGQAVGATLVNNCSNPSLFSLVDAAGYELEAVDGNLVLAEISPVVNATTGAKFQTLAAAVSAAADGETLVLNEDIVLTGRISLGAKSLTIKGATGKEVITRQEFDQYLLLMTKEYNLTLENLVLDGGNVECKASMLQAPVGSKLTLNNVEVTNCNTTNTRGLLDNSTSDNAGTWHLNNVSFTNCTVPNQEVTSNADGNTISGDNSFTLRINTTAADGVYYTVDAQGIANKSPMDVTLDRLIMGRTVITNCADRKQFNCANVTSNFWSSEGNLIIGALTGVDAIETEISEAPEYWYNLNGMPLAQKPTTPGLYIRRCGNKASKVFVK